MPEKKTQKTTAKPTKTKTPSRARKSSVKTQAVQSEKTVNKENASSPRLASLRSVRVRRTYIIIAAVILLLVAGIFLARNYLIAAMVNGQPISRLSVISELERQGGKQTLDTIITKTLIAQEAKKRNVTVSQKDIDNELKRLEQQYSTQGQKLDQVLAMNGMTKDQLVELIETQKRIEKMVGEQKVTDKEVDEYIERNRESLPQDQDEAVLKKNTKERLQQQKLNEKAQTFLDDLRKNAKIDYYVQY